VDAIKALLKEIQATLLQQATEFRDARLHDINSYDELKQVIEADGFARGWWNESPEDEARIKEETGATHRCYPLDQPGGKGKSFLTSEPAPKLAIFAKAY
jgi:prolyl-tRNA synthetase